MAENLITIRLCDEDRVRLDRLSEALERRNCDKCVTAALDCMKNTAPDPLHQALAETLAKVDEATGDEIKAPEAAKAETPTDTPPTEETPAPKAEQTETKPSVTLEQIQQKVVTLAAAGKKVQVREVITAYGSKVSDLKDQPEKWDEVWDKLTALEVSA